jgi:hypothetical protein
MAMPMVDEVFISFIHIYVINDYLCKIRNSAQARIMKGIPAVILPTAAMLIHYNIKLNFLLKVSPNKQVSMNVSFGKIKH